MIIVIVGETGSGKSFISRKLLPKYPNLKSITKYTTRKSRVDEKDVCDVKGDMSLDEISMMDYQYTNILNNEQYGVKKEEIDLVLKEKRIPCIDLSSEDAYLSIVKDYPNEVLLLKVVPYFDEESMEDTFKRQNRDAKEFEERKKVLDKPLTGWAYKYQNMREVINPYFLRNCPKEVSLNVILRRLESVLRDECKVDLGASYAQNEKRGYEIYRYLYGYSKNRPIDKEMSVNQNKNR